MHTIAGPVKLLSSSPGKFGFDFLDGGEILDLDYENISALTTVGSFDYSHNSRVYDMDFEIYQDRTYGVIVTLFVHPPPPISEDDLILVNKYLGKSETVEDLLKWV